MLRCNKTTVLPVKARRYIARVKGACSRESRAFVYVFPALCVMPKFETTHNPAERCEQIGFLGIHRSEENSYLYCVSSLDADHLLGLNNRVN